jgi:hypothetical protein
MPTEHVDLAGRSYMTNGRYFAIQGAREVSTEGLVIS